MIRPMQTFKVFLRKNIRSTWLKVMRFFVLFRAYCFLKIVSFFGATTIKPDKNLEKNSFYVKPDKTDTWDRPY